MKHVKKIIVLLMLLGGLVYVSLFSGAGARIKLIPLYIGDNKFTVEVADTDEKWTTGMMYREVVPDDFGMLFVSNVEYHRSFWMKNCLANLDIIFLDSYKQVINIHINVPPCKREPCPGYASERPAQYVLELRGNRAKELNLKPGDVVMFSYKQ
ncbi:MAG: DUF192 domain-containing protein [bacterium]|nr:DUF192 domain-containing protein [bacterium]